VRWIARLLECRILWAALLPTSAPAGRLRLLSRSHGLGYTA